MRDQKAKMDKDHAREVAKLKGDVNDLQSKMQGEIAKELNKLKQENSSLNQKVGNLETQVQ
jgi:phage host-nuclease inhibitor protein Gam